MALSATSAIHSEYWTPVAGKINGCTLLTCVFVIRFHGGWPRFMVWACILRVWSAAHLVGLGPVRERVPVLWRFLPHARSVLLSYFVECFFLIHRPGSEVYRCSNVVRLLCPL